MGKVTKATDHLTLEEIDERIKATVGFWRVKRWMVIRHAVANPMTAKEIGLNTGMAEQSVHNLIAAYNRNGEKAIETKGRGQRQKANLTLEEEKEFLKPFFEKAEKGQIATTAEIHETLNQYLGKIVHESSVYRLLNRHGWRKIVPRPTHPKTNKEEQEEFKKKNFENEVKEVLKTKEPEDKRPVMIMAQDEGRFGRINGPRRCWAPPGIRPTIFSQMVRQYIYAYSAVCPATGDITSLILPNADTACMNIFLEHISQEYSEYFIIMQADNAGWHKSKGLKIPENIRIIYQPAYSPQVNPVEHIWDEIREKVMQNIPFRSIKDVIDTLCKGLNNLKANIQKVKSMTGFPHLNITL